MTLRKAQSCRVAAVLPPDPPQPVGMRQPPPSGGPGGAAPAGGNVGGAERPAKRPRRAGSASTAKPPSAAEAASLRSVAASLVPGREALPVFACREALRRLLFDRRVLVLVGETGSGKSTQLPQLLLAWGRLPGWPGPGPPPQPCVAVAEPRRVAALSLARRVAAEAGCRVGGAVGYAVRFDEASGPGTVLRYVTDGHLLVEALADPTLSRYSAVVVDEARGALSALLVL